MSVEYVLYNPEDKTILWSGLLVDENTLPEVPEEYSHYIFGFGVKGDPEKYKVHIELLDGEEVLSLIDYTPPRSQEALLQLIEEERARRLSVGFNYNFGDERGVHRIGTTLADEVGWDKVTKLSMACILSGNPTATIQIVTNTGPVEITAAEWQQILIAVGAFQQPIYAVSFSLQQLDPIPQDVDKPEYWE